MIVLASSSPYRRSLLARLNLPFEIASPGIDESPVNGEAPQDMALRLAELKARAVAPRFPDALVIGSDQVAVLDGKALGKPGDQLTALAQLAAMRGRSVIFHTALCVYQHSTGRLEMDNVPTTVHLRNYSDAQAQRYLEIDRPYDCAGSAKIESLGIALAHRVESSDPTALVGLPLIALTTLLARCGIDVL